MCSTKGTLPQRVHYMCSIEDTLHVFHKGTLHVFHKGTLHVFHKGYITCVPQKLYYMGTCPLITCSDHVNA